MATEAYESFDHALGVLDVRFQRVQWALGRGAEAASALNACRHGYQKLDNPQGEISVLQALSQHALSAGRANESFEYCRQIAELVDRTGAGLVRDNILLTEADLLMRTNQYRSAIELCAAEIANAPPELTAGNYRQLMASAYALLGDKDRAKQEASAAFACFERLGAESLASVAAANMANDLFSQRDAQARATGFDLLRDWVQRDIVRKNFADAADKHLLLAQGYVQEANATPDGVAGSSARKHLDNAERELQRADELAKNVAGRNAFKCRGNGWQMRGQVEHLRGREEATAAAWIKAEEMFESGGFDLELANCRYMRGVLARNGAHRNLQSKIVATEMPLSQALDFYTRMGMNDRAADCRWMLAHLYADVARYVSGEPAVKLDQEALRLLALAEADFDAIRRRYSARSPIEAQSGKRAIVKKSARIYSLALALSLRHGENDAIWDWVQRGKARAFTDTLGAHSPPAAIMNTLKTDAGLFELAEREQALLAELSTSTPSEWHTIDRAIEKMHGEMSHVCAFDEYLRFRLGAPPSRASAQAELALQGKPSAVCVDWFAVNGQFWIVLLAASGPVELIPTGLSLDRVQAWIQSHLAPNPLRATLRAWSGWNRFRAAHLLVAHPSSSQR
jgi:hypothetical protein